VLHRGPLLTKTGEEKFEIGRILHLRSEIRNLRLDSPVHQLWPVQFAISDFGSEMQDSSNFKFPKSSA
jgi:hypothetical protein